APPTATPRRTCFRAACVLTMPGRYRRAYRLSRRRRPPIRGGTTPKLHTAYLVCDPSGPAVCHGGTADGGKTRKERKNRTRPVCRRRRVRRAPVRNHGLSRQDKERLMRLV